MLQVWKIEVPTHQADCSELHGWALAETAEEARSLSGYETAIITQKPEHLWIAAGRVIWDRQKNP